MYRIYGLPPGEYYLGVTHGMVGAGTAGHETTAADLRWARARIAGTASAAAPGAGSTGEPIGQGPLTVYSPTFHPGAATLAEAAPIMIAQGEERQGVDVMVRFVRSVTLTGLVAAPDAEGQAPSGAWAASSRLPSRPPGGSRSTR